MRRVAQTTLLLAGLSFGVSSELLAQEALTKEAQRSGASAIAAPEQPTELKPREPSPDTSSARPIALTVTAASLGTAGGIVGGYIGGVMLCEISGFGGGVWGLDCFGNSVVLGGSVLTGIAGGYFGYKNQKTVVTLGGALAGTGVGLALWLPVNSDEYLLPVVLLSAGAGGYLGHRLWKVRDATSRRVSVSPFWDEDGAGVVVLGEF